MADAKLTKIGLDSAVATEVAAMAPAGEAPAPTNVDPSDERRVVGVSKYKAPDGSITVVTNL
jgi:hypothetical protein